MPSPNVKSKLPTMDVEKVFHMKEGQGDASYARNSSAQVRFSSQHKFHQHTLKSPQITPPRLGRVDSMIN